MSPNNKTIKILALIGKVLIVICAFTFIYLEVFKNEDYNSISLYFDVVLEDTSNIWTLILTLILMPLNWLIESIKWRYLLMKIEKIKLSKAIQAVLSGVTISAILPNRTGEFVGKIAYVNQADRIQAALLSVLGSISQLTATLVIGTLSLVFLLLSNAFPLEKIVVISGSTFLLSIAFISVLFYFNSAILFTIVKSTRFLNRFSKYVKVFNNFSRTELMKVLQYSLLRYVTFTVQFILLLMFFKVDVSFFQSLISVTTSFFVISTIPSPALAEIGIRESTSLFFIGLYTTNSIGIVSAAFTLWLINIATPAIIGSIFVLRAKFI